MISVFVLCTMTRNQNLYMNNLKSSCCIRFLKSKPYDLLAESNWIHLNFCLKRAAKAPSLCGWKTAFGFKDISSLGWWVWKFGTPKVKQLRKKSWHVTTTSFVLISVGPQVGYMSSLEGNHPNCFIKFCSCCFWGVWKHGSDDSLEYPMMWVQVTWGLLMVIVLSWSRP